MDIKALMAQINRLHFVGIGGAGMFPLVEILQSEGYQITGSDVNESSIVARVRALGLPVFIGHDAAHIGDAQALVVSAALLPGNPEVARARELGLPIIERAELLGYITARCPQALCISGTHGKTTASSMLTMILLEAGLDPTAVIGGLLPAIDGYGRKGGDVMVCEACEFKDTFLALDPYHAVILDIDADHLDYFGTLDNVKASFRRFAGQAKSAVIANGDDANTLDALAGLDKKIVLFGEGAHCDYCISDIRDEGRARFSFALSDADGMLGRFQLSVPGRHHIFNAAAAAVSALLLGVSAGDIARGLSAFKGAGRRFEILGEFGGITIADDYAHHPAEIHATLTAARGMGYDRLIALFQPFTFSRTSMLLDDFAKALSLADQVVLTAIMGSREVNTYSVSAADLAAKIPGAVWFETQREAADYCLSMAQKGDLILTLGCGDIYKAAHSMVEQLKNKTS